MTLKRILIVLAILLVTLTGCNKNIPSETDTSAQDTEKEGKALVVVFSATGNTRKLGQQIADVLKADFYEIEPVEPYSQDDLNYGDNNSRTSKERHDDTCRPEIKSAKITLEDYDTVYLGYPIWHGQAPRILYTFVEMYDFEGKTIIPFCTSGSSPIGSSASNLQKVCTNGNWKEGTRLKNDMSEEEISAWLKQISN